ncbi:MAG TPA: glycosyltransferase, partial [Acidimicrobiia bacterium]|nr:glycosyltransferase [Acidimicrobiia bacterium]
SMLRRLAGPTVEFREHVPDDELASLLAGCAALVQAGVEDFGLAPIEANAAGRPAVAFAAAGALESVVDGETGVLFHEPSVAALVDAIERAEATGWDADALRAHARSMGEERFHQRLLAALSELGFNDLATPPAPPPPGPARRDWSGARVWRR